MKMKKIFLKIKGQKTRKQEKIHSVVEKLVQDLAKNKHRTNAIGFKAMMASPTEYESLSLPS